MPTKKKNIFELTVNNLADGVWIVERNGDGKRRVLQIGELPKLYPFAEMAMDQDKLATYLRAKVFDCIAQTMSVNPDGAIFYSFPSASNMAHDILKFLAEPDFVLAKLKYEMEYAPYTVDFDGTVRSKNGALVFSKFSEKAIEFAIEHYEKQIAELKNRLTSFQKRGKSGHAQQKHSSSKKVRVGK